LQPCHRCPYCSFACYSAALGHCGVLPRLLLLPCCGSQTITGASAPFGPVLPTIMFTLSRRRHACSSSSPFHWNSSGVCSASEKILCYCPPKQNRCEVESIQSNPTFCWLFVSAVSPMPLSQHCSARSTEVQQYRKSISSLETGIQLNPF
jgi:hypothetical protein